MYMVLRHQLILAQNGWPSVTYQGVEPNNAAAVANVQNEQVGQIDEIKSVGTHFKFDRTTSSFSTRNVSFSRLYRVVGSCQGVVGDWTWEFQEGVWGVPLVLVLALWACPLSVDQATAVCVC